MAARVTTPRALPLGQLRGLQRCLGPTARVLGARRHHWPHLPPEGPCSSDTPRPSRTRQCPGAECPIKAVGEAECALEVYVTGWVVGKTGWNEVECTGHSQRRQGPPTALLS